MWQCLLSFKENQTDQYVCLKELVLSTYLYQIISLTLTQCQINWFERNRIKYFSLPNDIFDINIMSNSPIKKKKKKT